MKLKIILMKKIYTLLALLVIFCGLTVSAHATLIDRGGGMIYDTDLNITWLQDANYAKTSGYDADGGMTWEEAMTWTSNLVYGGYDNWRLPTALNTDVSECIGWNCTGSEMGHLYYIELGNAAGGPLINSGPFINLISGAYWSGTETGPGAADAFWFWEGYSLGSEFKEEHLLAWAVHDGDVVAVAEPSTLLLICAGLLVFLFFGRKQFLQQQG